MQYEDLVRALMEMRSKTQLQGRPMSPNETRDIAGAWFNTAENKALQGRAINFQEKNATDQLAVERWKMLAMLDAAKKGSKNQMWQNLIKGGVTLGGMAYLK